MDTSESTPDDEGRQSTGPDLEAIRREAARRRPLYARRLLAGLLRGLEAGDYEEFEGSDFHLALLATAAPKERQRRRFLADLTRRYPRPLVRSRRRALLDRDVSVRKLLDPEAAVAEALLRSGVVEMWNAANQGEGGLDLDAASRRFRILLNEAATHQVATRPWKDLRRKSRDVLDVRVESVSFDEVEEAREELPDALRVTDNPMDSLLREAEEARVAQIEAEAGLSPSQEAVWHLHFRDGLGPHEIARLTDRAPGTARSLLSKARRKIRQTDAFQRLAATA